MRLHRFFIEQPLGEELVIQNKDLMKQWFLVFRYKTSDSVILFNGNGNDYTYSISSHDKSACVLQFLHTTKSNIPEKKVSLLLSLIKKDNLELIIQKGTELGVSSFILFTSSRSEKKNIDAERLKRIAIEATEQCGRGNIPIIKGIFDLPSALLEARDAETLYVLDIDGVPASSLLEKKGAALRNVSLCIGPEGGWTDEEREIFKQKNLQFIKLTETTLRAETAAIVGSYTFLAT